MHVVAQEQGSDLRELRLTWKEMENLIFERFIRIFGDILEDFWTIFEEFWRNWFIVRRLRTSLNLRPTKKMRFYKGGQKHKGKEQNINLN